MFFMEICCEVCPVEFKGKWLLVSLSQLLDLQARVGKLLAILLGNLRYLCPLQRVFLRRGKLHEIRETSIVLDRILLNVPWLPFPFNLACKLDATILASNRLPNIYFFSTFSNRIERMPSGDIVSST